MSVELVDTKPVRLRGGGLRVAEDTKQAYFADGNDAIFEVGRSLGAITLAGPCSKGELLGRSRVEVVASATAVSSSDATTVAPAKPTGTQDGDLLIAFIGRLYDNSSTSFTAPSGWTLLLGPTGTVADKNAWSVYYKIAASEGSSYTFTADVADRLAAMIITVRGADEHSPFDVSSAVATASGTSHAATGVTTTERNTLLLALMGVDAAAATFSPPTGFTEIADTVSTGTGNDVTIEASYKRAVAIGAQAATGTSSQTGSGGAFLLAIKPGFKRAENTALLYWRAQLVALEDGVAGDSIAVADPDGVWVENTSLALLPGAVCYLGTGGLPTTTRPTTANALKQVVGKALTATAYLARTDQLREVDIPLRVVKYTGAEGDTLDTTLLDSGIFPGYALNAQNEYITFLGRFPDNVITLVRVPVALSQDTATGGGTTPTLSFSTASVVSATAHDAITSDTSESAKTVLADADAADPITEYDALAAFDAEQIVQAGNWFVLKILKADAGTVETLIHGATATVLVA